MPFEEIQHTADWCLRVRAGSLEELFTEAARGMNALSGAQPEAGARVKQTFSAQAEDAESLLVQFLSELVFAAEQEKLIFDDIHVEINDSKLKATMYGAWIGSLIKTIKAVTYHNLQIRNSEEGYEVEIVFDV